MDNHILAVQHYLLKRSLADLERDHNVLGKPGSYKFSLNYDQILANDENALAMECRGLVLMRRDRTIVADLHDVVGETDILAFPFRRFFNLGQKAAAPVDFENENTRFFEKEDGTLIIVYHDPAKEEWCVATRSVCEANLPIDGSAELTFRLLFEQTLMQVTGTSFPEWTKFLQKDWTYCFELTTPVNQVVVAHEHFMLHLLMVRNNKTFQEPPFHMLEGIANVIGVPLPKTYRFASVDETIQFVNARNGIEFEGVVVCDQNHNRIKIKSTTYLQASKLITKMGATARNMLQYILTGTADDVFPILPKYHQEKLAALQDGVRKLDKHYNAVFAEIMSSIDGEPGTPLHRKNFAVQVNQRKEVMGFLMAMYILGPDAEFLNAISNSKREYSNSMLDTLLAVIQRLNKGNG
jgi:hypothetical protein